MDIPNWVFIVLFVVILVLSVVRFVSLFPTGPPAPVGPPSWSPIPMDGLVIEFGKISGGIAEVKQVRLQVDENPENDIRVCEHSVFFASGGSYSVGLNWTPNPRIDK